MNYDVVLNANDAAALETQYAFTQGDYGNIQFSIRVKADGQYVTDATRAYIVFTLPNGMIVTGADMPKSVATYTYVFQGNELQAPGKIVADVKLVYANGQISSNKFAFTCRPDPLADKNISAGPYITALQKIVDEGQEKIDYLQALIDTLQEGVGETALTRNDLQNNRDPVDAGLKAIDANMAQNLFLKSEVINANTTTTAGFAADARQLNPNIPGSLAAQLATTNSNLDNHVTLSGTNCEIVYNKAICILKIQAIGISLIGGNAINSNKFTLPTNVHLNFNIYEKLTLLDVNWAPYSSANDCYVSILSNGTINIRCSANVTNAVLVGSIILPRSAVSIT